MYISITGLKVKSFLHTLTFWRYAIPSFMQAEKAPGNLHASTKTIEGIHYTVTAWKSKAAMKAYIYSGVHAKAIRKFPKIATGKTFGFDSETIPSWSEIPSLWKANGSYYKNNDET